MQAERMIIAKVTALSYKVALAPLLSGRRLFPLPLHLGGENTGGGAARGLGRELEWTLCPIHPQAHCTLLAMTDCPREAQEVARSPWERLHANAKLSDLERVSALPWQKKPLRNPENTD